MYPGISIYGPIRATYRIDSRDAFDPGSAWQPLTTVTLTESPFLWIDETPFKRARRFYRALPLSL